MAPLQIGDVPKSISSLLELYKDNNNPVHSSHKLLFWLSQIQSVARTNDSPLISLEILEIHQETQFGLQLVAIQIDSVGACDGIGELCNCLLLFCTFQNSFCWYLSLFILFGYLFAVSVPWLKNDNLFPFNKDKRWQIRHVGHYKNKVQSTDIAK